MTLSSTISSHRLHVQPGRPQTNSGTILLSDGQASPESQVKKLRRAGLPIPPGLRLRWRAHRRLVIMPPDEREALGPAILNRLRRDLEALTHPHPIPPPTGPTNE